MVNKTEKKVWNLQKAFYLHTVKVCRFEIIDSVKYVNCIFKHAYKFLLRKQVGFAAALWRLCQCVSCYLLSWKLGLELSSNKFVFNWPCVPGDAWATGLVKCVWVTVNIVLKIAFKRFHVQQMTLECITCVL